MARGEGKASNTHDRIGGGRFLLLLGMLVAFGPLATDLYLPALPAIRAGLGTTPEAVQLSITVFLGGFSIGMLGYGPVSDRYGRRPVMLGGIGLFVVASLACLLATSVEQLIVARFVQALGGGAASVLARAVVRDVFSQTEALRKLSLLAMITAIAPLLSPLLGSVILDLGGWRATFGAVLAWGILSLATVFFLLPETLPAERRGQLSLGKAFSAYLRLLGDPVAVGLLLAGGMSFAGMFAYITASPYYLIELQRFSPRAYSVLFAANALGIFAANYANSRLLRRCGAVTMIGGGCVAGFAGALTLLLGVSLHDYVPAVVLGLLLMVSVTGLLGANCVGLLMERYPLNTGAAAALFVSGQFGLGMLASAGVSALHDGSGLPMAGVITATASLSMLGLMLFRHSSR